jgi:hypothetical protein
MNQLFELLQKEVGKVQLMSLRHVPIPKDGDAQDALDIWEMEARKRGVVFIDDSPENLKSPSSFNQFTALDLTRTQEIQTRYNLAVQIKNECWELIGMSKQRMGNVTASESATGTNTAVQQSYTQTEPLYVAHEYTLGQLYQAIIDASQFIESSKPESTVSYVNGEGTAAFIQVNGTDIKFKDLKVFPTNRPEDTQMFNDIRALSQAIIQNGGSVYDIVELYSSKSQRELKKVFKDLRDKQDAIQQQAAQQKQQELDQANQMAQAGLQEAARLKQEEMLNQNNENELDRINKKEIALLNALGRNPEATADTDASGVADALEISNLAAQEDAANKTHEAKLADIQSKTALGYNKLSVEREKLQVDRDNQKNDLEIAKINARNRSANKK